MYTTRFTEPERLTASMIFCVPITPPLYVSSSTFPEAVGWFCLELPRTAATCPSAPAHANVSARERGA